MREPTIVNDFYIEVLEGNATVVLRTTNRKGSRVPDDFLITPDIADMLAAALQQAADNVRLQAPSES